MPVPLKRFPFLVQIEIFKSFDYPEILSMSFCSLKTAARIKTLNFKRSDAIQCTLTQKSTHIQIGERNNFYEIGSFMHKDVDLPKTIDVKFANTKMAVVFDMLFPSQVLTMVYKFDGTNRVENAIIQHVSDLFRNMLAIRLFVYDHENYDEIPVIERATEVYLFGTEINADAVNCVKKFPQIDFLHIKEELKMHIEFPEVQTLHLIKAGVFAKTILPLNFNGTSLLLYNTILDNNDIQNFVRQWFNKENYNNISFVNIETKDNQQLFNQDIILANFNTFAWDPEVRPGRYEYYDPILRSLGRPFPINIENDLDIYRDDNSLASINITATSFRFIVWKNKQKPEVEEVVEQEAEKNEVA